MILLTIFVHCALAVVLALKKKIILQLFCLLLHKIVVFWIVTSCVDNYWLS